MTKTFTKDCKAEKWTLTTKPMRITKAHCVVISRSMSQLFMKFKGKNHH